MQETEPFPPVFMNEYDVRLVSEEGPRKVIAIHRPIGIMTRHAGKDCRFWTGCIIARYYPVFDEIYVMASNKRGEPLLWQTWNLRDLGSELHDSIAKFFEPPVYV